MADRASKLRLGDGLDPASEVGPLVNRDQRDRVHSYVEIGKGEGAKLIAGGSAATDGPLSDGAFYRPTIFDQVKPSMRIAQEEIFGPVLSVLTVSSLEEAIQVLNGTPFGLSSSIYTRDVNRAMRAIRDIEAGITYINGPTIGAEVQLPFGGVKETGNGDYSGRLQKAQIDR